MAAAGAGRGSLPGSVSLVQLGQPTPAGPGGGTAAKPVGLVHIAAASKGGAMLHQECRFGDIGRSEVRRLSVLFALTLLSELASR